MASTVTAKIAENKSKGKDKSKKRIRLASGQLAEMEEAGIQQMSEAQGLVRPPSTPVGAGMVGVGPDAAKMAGTKAQKQGVLQQTSAPDAQLADVQRRQQARTTATADEVGQMAQVEHMQALGSVYEATEDLISSYMGAGAPTDTVKLVGTEDLDEETKALLNEWFNPSPDTDTKQLLVDLEKAGIKSHDLERYAGRAAVGDAIQDPDAVTLGALWGAKDETGRTFEARIGMDMEALSELLSIGDDIIAPADLQNLTIEQLGQRIAQVENAEFEKLSELETIANDPNASAAERAEARRLLRDAGAVGTRSAQQQAEDLAAAVEEGGVIVFGGKRMSYEEILDDEYLNQLSEEYLYGTDIEKEEFRDKYGHDLPNLIDKFEGAFEKAASDRQTELTEFEDVQKAKQQLIEDSGLSEEELTNIFGVDFGEKIASLPDYSNIPFLQILTNKKDTRWGTPEMTNFLFNVKAISSMSPEIAKELAGLSEQELEDMGLYEKEADNQRLASYLHWKSAEAVLADLDPDSAEAKGILLDLIAGPLHEGRADESLLADLAAEAKVGTYADRKTAKELLALLDADADGRMDDTAAVKEKLEGYMSKISTDPQALIANKDQTHGLLGVDPGRHSDELTKLAGKEYDIAKVSWGDLVTLSTQGNKAMREEAAKELQKRQENNNKKLLEKKPNVKAYGDLVGAFMEDPISGAWSVTKEITGKPVAKVQKELATWISKLEAAIDEKRKDGAAPYYVKDLREELKLARQALARVDMYARGEQKKPSKRRL